MSRASAVDIENEITIWGNTDKNGNGTPLIPVLNADGQLQIEVVSGGTAGVQYTEGDTDSSITGTAAMAENSDTLKPLRVDSSGNLFVNVAAGSASSEQYADGTAVDSSYKGNLILGTDGTNYQILAVDSSGNLQIDVLTLPALPAGTNNIGKVDIASIAAGDNNIGNVDIVTVPAPLNVTGGGTESSALRVTIANDSTGVISVDDNGGSLTVDGQVDIGDISKGTQTNDVKITLDGEAVVLGSPTDGTYIGDIKFGEGLPAGTNTIGSVKLTDGTEIASINASNQLEVAVGNTVSIQDGGNVISIDDGGGSITVDGSVSIGSALPVGNNNIGDVDVASLPAIPAGTNNIGKIDVNSLPAGTNNIGDVDVATQPARAATTDSVTAKLATDALQNGLTAVTPKFAVINAATSGDNEIVAAVTGKKIRVLQYTLVCAAATNIKWESGTTALSGVMSIAANSGLSPSFSPVGLFETAAGAALNLNLSAANQVSGSLVYCEI